MKITELVRAACTVCGLIWTCPKEDASTFVCMNCEDD